MSEIEQVENETSENEISENEKNENEKTENKKTENEIVENEMTENEDAESDNKTYAEIGAGEITEEVLAKHKEITHNGKQINVTSFSCIQY